MKSSPTFIPGIALTLGAILFFACPALASNEVQATAPSGKTLYAEIISSVGDATTGKVWQSGNTFAVVTNTSLIAQTIPMTEQGTTGLYLGSFPSTITTPGSYLTLVYTRAGASPAIGDALSGSGGLDWTGTTLASEGITQPSVVANTATLGTVNTNASALLLSLAPYQSALTTGSTTTALLTGLTGTADLTGSKVVFTTGVNKGVARTISAMNTTTGAITLLKALPTTPGTTDAFSVVQGSKALEQFLAALGTDSRPVLSGNTQPAVTASNLPSDYARNNVSPAWNTITGDTYALLNPLVSAGHFTAPALSLAPTGGTAPTVNQIAAAILQTPANLLATDSSGKVSLQAADHAALAGDVFGAAFITIPGSHTTSGTQVVLTYKQWAALVDALPGGDNTSTAPVKSGTSTVTYYLRGQAKTTGTIVAVSTVTYDANGNQTGRTVLTAQPFPAVN